MSKTIRCKKIMATITAILGLAALLPVQEASAQRRFAARGANGGGAGFAQRFQNGGGAAAAGGRFKNGAAGGYATQSQYGTGVGGAVLTPYGGGGFHRNQFAGPNGGTAQSSGAGAYKPGVGAFRQGSFSGTAANGASANGNSNMQYNAQTGQGTRNSNAQFTSAAGENYGGSSATTYTRGQGTSTSLQTNNNGSYDITHQQGQKPVVTPTSVAPSSP